MEFLEDALGWLVAFAVADLVILVAKKLRRK